MSVLIRERSSDSLTGDIDGANQRFLITFSANPDTVAVYRNGLLIDPSRDNGYTFLPPNDVRMKIAPLVGDTLEVEYQSDVLTGGGADGGVPSPPVIEVLEPDLLAEGEETPELEADSLKPSTSTTQDRPEVVSEDLRPEFASIEEC
jgi:hypothetical protein